jgi:hypothetical protein
MGWKSKIYLTREEAIDAILSAIDRTSYERMTNTELEYMMYILDIGDNTDLPYYGYNFWIVNSQEEKDERLAD